MATVLQEYNAGLPALSLPPEILSDVLSLVQHDRQGVSDEYIPQFPRSAHVCSSWRRVALGTPALWNVLNIARPKLSLALYEHSSFPVKVFGSARWSSVIVQKFVNRALGDPSRLLELDVKLSSHMFPLSFRGPAPWLRRLVIELLGSYQAKDSAIRERLNALTAPDLSSLTLINVGLDSWSSPLFLAPRLRSLHIHASLAGPSPSLQNILGVLGQLQHLEKLSLHHALPVASTNFGALQCDVQGESDRVVDLLTLKDLAITSHHARDCLSFLQCLRFRPLCRLYLCCEQGGKAKAQQIWDFATMHCDVLQAKAPSEGGENSTALEISMLGSFSICCAPFSQHSQKPEEHSLTITFLMDDVEEEEKLDILETLSSRLVALKPVALSFADRYSGSSRVCSALLRHNPHVRSLSLRCPSLARDILPILVTDDLAPDLTSLAIAVFTEKPRLAGEILDCCVELLEKRRLHDVGSGCPSSTVQFVEFITFPGRSVRDFEQYKAIKARARVTVTAVSAW
ncbi:hypothetical protein PUNSTDRAFT_133562 [Punctularia strigosozonata HHB-11173 SS5]|uniref:uncharacterized protein n=1 Tax=Punctularia strigosozonata (strain HHB-11173) TaxID=741275 RepID=UPI0004417311|nr:uncharacterized protein PUNSTDRAFT_133562 [Punctularia strigosozonata HHB-11173 SS5]EIN09791.1 hypothetical protein PUNSTDRAFT_133562 [Punctularia strigosozonata HHB-11173 SS5]